MSSVMQAHAVLLRVYALLAGDFSWGTSALKMVDVDPITSNVPVEQPRHSACHVIRTACKSLWAPNPVFLSCVAC